MHKPLNTIGIITKRTIAENKDYVLKLHKELTKVHKKKVLCDTNSAPLVGDKKGYTRKKLLQKCDMVIVLGGDGTLLKTARCVDRKKTYVLAVNMGTLGFLTELTPDKVFSALKKIFKNEYVIDRRRLLRVTVYRGKKKIATSLAMNDAVINQGTFARVIKLRLEIDQRKVAVFHADGVIVATPTGSTGHSLSAGGPIVHPKLEGLVVTPICPVAMTVRPIIIPDSRQLKIIVETQRMKENVGLTLDGQEIYDLEYGDEIKVRKSHRHFHMIRLHGKGYYRMLREKLSWGKEYCK